MVVGAKRIWMKGGMEWRMGKLRMKDEERTEDRREGRCGPVKSSGQDVLPIR